VVKVGFAAVEDVDAEGVVGGVFAFGVKCDRSGAEGGEKSGAEAHVGQVS